MSLVNPAAGHPETQGFAGHNSNEAPGWLARSLYYGKRSLFQPSTFFKNLHLAIDYACAVGTVLVAPETCIIAAQGTIAHFPDGSADGEIYSIGIIRKMPTYWTMFLLTHLSAFLHPVNARVLKGQPLVKSGESGKVTGPHVHFELAVIPAGLGASYFWNKNYMRYDPTTFYAGGSQSGSVIVQSNV